jgi:hypothetical protein
MMKRFDATFELREILTIHSRHISGATIVPEVRLKADPTFGGPRKSVGFGFSRTNRRIATHR